MKDDRLYLVHIQESIKWIQEFTSGGKEDFLDDRKTQDAVLRNLHTLSESAQRLTPGLKSQYAEVEWRAISGFRNVVVHDYLGVDLDQMWDIIEKDLPVLKQQVDRILATLK